MRAGEERALYVYAFTRADDALRISAPPVEGEGEVRALRLGEIAAVVSPIEVEAFQGPEAEARLEDLEWMTQRALRHEAVVEEVMRSRPVLPLTFGVVFSRERALAEAVEPHRREIARFIDEIEDKEEWALKVYADMGKLRRWVEQAPEFRTGLGELPASPGARYLHEKRLDRELDRLAERERAEGLERIRAALEPTVLATRGLRVLSREMTGRRDEMVWNVACLVAADRVEPFHEAVARMSEALRDRGLTIEATGPWPPYNFGPDLRVEP